MKLVWKVKESKKEAYNLFLLYTISFLAIVVAGLYGILCESIFWYSTGLFTIPWIRSLLSVLEKEEKQK